MPIDRNPGPCRLPSSFLPHERRSSKSECGRNAAGSDFSFPLYCAIVLSCLALSYSPRPPLLLLGLLFVSRTVTVSTFWLGTRAAVQCASFSSCLTLPASQSDSQSSQPGQSASPAYINLLEISVRTVPCHPGCRLQEPYYWNHTTRVLDDCPAGRCVICGIRFDPPCCTDDTD